MMKKNNNFVFISHSSFLCFLFWFLLCPFFFSSSSHHYSVLAIPGLFHEANSFDIHGQQCPLPSFSNLECSVLCTTDINQCPSALRPECNSGETYCPHGACVPNPKNLPVASICPLSTTTSVCSCPDHPHGSNLDPSLLWFPCQTKTASRFVVNLPSTPFRFKEEKLNSTCHQLIQAVPSNILTYLSCAPLVPQFSYKEPIWLSFWSALACQCLLLFIYIPMKWSLEKKATRTWKSSSSSKEKESKHRSNTNNTNLHDDFSTSGGKSTHFSSLSPAEGCHPIHPSTHPTTSVFNSKTAGSERGKEREDDFTQKQPAEETLLFYQSHTLGRIAYYMTILYTLFIFVFLQLVIADYYTTLDAPANFFVDASLIPTTFILIWHCLVALVLLWKLKSPVTMRQFFRIRIANPLHAEYVLVQRRISPSSSSSASSSSSSSFQAGHSHSHSHPPRSTCRWLMVLSRCLSRFERWVVVHFGFDKEHTCHRIRLTPYHRIPYFYDTALRYMYSVDVRTFRPHVCHLASTLAGLIRATRKVHEQSGGLTLAQVQARLEWLGPNKIDLSPPSFLALLARELSGWFYIYQFAMLQVWYYFLYWKMGLVLTLFILATALYKSYVRYKAFQRIHPLVSKSTKVVVMRDHQLVTVDDTQLVPGDLIMLSHLGSEVVANEVSETNITNNKKCTTTTTTTAQLVAAPSPPPLTVDVLVMKGRVLVDESCISGESKPIDKTPIPEDLVSLYEHVPLDIHRHHPHVVLAGTSILQSSKAAFGVVLTTQLHSSRGHLIQKLLKPLPTLSAFHDQLKIVLLFLFLWGTVCFSLVVYFMWDGTSTAWFYAVFMITEIISPLLPAVLVAGQSVAAVRLQQQHQITCTDLERIALAGKTKVFCFDKTGTLTEKKLAFSRFLSHRLLLSTTTTTTRSSSCALQGLVSDMDRVSVHEADGLSMLEKLGFLTCHTLTVFNTNVVGHPVESALFEFVNTASSVFDLVGDTVVDDRGQSVATIVHRYPFEHDLQSMGVVVQVASSAPSASSPLLLSSSSSSSLTLASLVKSFSALTNTSPPSSASATSSSLVFFKGAYEKIRTQCVSVPAFFDDAHAAASKAGGYVLALAARWTSATDTVPAHRDDAMSALHLLGLVVLRNPLKGDTQSVIRAIQHGGCATVMITGDALFTGVHVARECGFLPGPGTGASTLVSTSSSSSLPFPSSSSSSSSSSSFSSSSSSSSLALVPRPCLYADVDHMGSWVWRDIDTDAVVSRQVTPDPWRHFDFAVTGHAWDHLMQLGSPPAFLNHIKVFARMAPDQKAHVVKAFLAHGVVAMCGDGANDCGALHAATVGVALSDCESALVAPFSTRATASLDACVRVLTEGRSALASSFAGYKFLIMYGMTMSSMCLTMYYFQIVLPQFIWISIDGVIVVASCITLTKAKSLTTLSKHRPSMNLLGLQTVGSILLHTFTHWSFLMGAVYFLFQQAWFRCHEFDPFAIDLSKWWLLGDNYEASVISTMVIFQFINNGALFNFGDRFRQAWYTNTWYVAFYLGCMTFMSALVLADPFYLNCLFRINCGDPTKLVELGYTAPSFEIPHYNSLDGHNVMPTSFRWRLWGLAMTNAVLCLILERWVVLGVLRYLASKTQKVTASKGKQDK